MLIWQFFATIGWPKEYKEYQEAKTKLSALKVHIYHFSLLIYLLIHLYINLSTFSPSCADVSMRLPTLSILSRLLKPLIERLNVPHKLGGYERSPNRNNQPRLDLVASYSYLMTSHNTSRLSQHFLPRRTSPKSLNIRTAMVSLLLSI